LKIKLPPDLSEGITTFPGRFFNQIRSVLPDNLTKKIEPKIFLLLGILLLLLILSILIAGLTTEKTEKKSAYPQDIPVHIKADILQRYYLRHGNENIEQDPPEYFVEPENIDASTDKNFIPDFFARSKLFSDDEIIIKTELDKLLK